MPTEWFRRRVVEFGVSLADFGRHQAEEVIILTRNTRAQIGSLTATADRKTRERIDYGDTAATRAMRKAVRRLNAFLSSADIAFLDDREAPLVDPYDRVLRRHYVLLPEQTKPRFDQSGRLFGAFWLNMKSQRRSGIRIGGEPVVNLDYGSMFTRLAYADIGTVPPEGDLYAIPELTGYRSGVKMAMNCLLFDNGPRRSWPASMGVGVGTDEDADRGNEDAAVYDARLPAGWGVKRTKQAILRRHPSLAAAWSRQLGYKLMHIESEILMAVLQELMARGIPALGLHDGLMVAASKVEVAKDMMTSKAQQAVGLPIPVSVKFIH